MKKLSAAWNRFKTLLFPAGQVLINLILLSHHVINMVWAMPDWFGLALQLREVVISIREFLQAFSDPPNTSDGDPPDEGEALNTQEDGTTDKDDEVPPAC